MLVMVSGEGSTDVGTMDGQDFIPGPMACFVDQWLEKKMQYSLLEAGMLRFVSEHELTIKTKMIAPRTGRGKKKGKETKYFYKNARALARIAEQVRREEHTPVMAVLFRDSDGTRSSGRGEWRDKFDSMLGGFAVEHFEFGVPMLPKPKSEAWILCALREQYNHCDKLEQESGSDNSPNSLKKQLEIFLETRATRELLVDKIKDGHLDITRINMPSMKAFKDRCNEVLD